MRYKVIGILCLVAVLLISVTAPLLTVQKEPTRYHQHREKAPYTACKNHGDEVFCSHLPLVEIDTGGADIPGAPYYDEKVDETKISTTATGDSVLTCDTKIIDNQNANNHLADKPAVTSKAQIRVRGNSSRYFAKKGYEITLVDDAGASNPQAVMGMDAHQDWVLHGPYLDKSLIRNYMWYNIAGEMMDYAPNVRFCEVFINGEYMGLYLMTERITAGKDNARLPLSVEKKHNTFTGYLLRIDRGSSVPLKNIDTFLVYSKNYPLHVNIEYPGTQKLTPEMARSIQLEFSDFEKALYSYDFDSKDYGYRKYIDVDNFVDYVIISEVTCNYDAGYYSTYFYKDRDGKIKVCVWDFNNCCNNYQETAFDVNNTFEMSVRPYFYMLMKSDYFNERVIQRYREWRKTCLSDAYIDRYIRDTVAYLGPAVERNFERWGSSFDEPLLENEKGAPDRNLHSHEEAVAQLNTFLDNRLKWMDENIEALQSYSADSRIKKYSEATE